MATEISYISKYKTVPNGRNLDPKYKCYLTSTELEKVDEIKD